MDSVSEFPFVSELPKREVNKVRSLWDELYDFAVQVSTHGVPVPPTAAARLLGVSNARVYQLIDAGRLKTITDPAGRQAVTLNSLRVWAEAEHKNGRPSLKVALQEANKIAKIS